jgi:hypothetical protein
MREFSRVLTAKVCCEVPPSLVVEGAEVGVERLLGSVHREIKIRICYLKWVLQGEIVLLKVCS